MGTWSLREKSRNYTTCAFEPAFDGKAIGFRWVGVGVRVPSALNPKTLSEVDLDSNLRMFFCARFVRALDLAEPP